VRVFIRKKQVEDHLVEEDFFSHAHAYAHAAAWYRERVVKAARNPSFFTQKNFVALLSIGQFTRVGSTERSKKNASRTTYVH